MNPACNLILVGPMGAGKSSLGRRFAAHFGLDFVDLDEQIERRSGAPINLIFELEGEDGFRRRESRLLAEFSAKRGIVLASGGGVILDAGNRKLLAERGFVVWLDASVEQQLERLARDTSRPLLQRPDRRAKLDELAARRNPLYAASADLHLAARSESFADTAARAIAAIEAAWTREVVA